MRIRRVEIKNFRRIASSSVEFGDGLIAIIGENASGKTTLIEAIFWALFGNTKELLRKGRKEDLRGADAVGDVYVVLEFEMDGCEYRIERRMKSRTDDVDALLWGGNTLLAKGNDAVNAKIIDILGMDWKEFRRSVYSPQKEIDALSDVDPKKRKEFIAGVLGINIINDRVLPEIREDIKDKKKELEFLYARVQKSDEVEKKKAKDFLEKEIANYEKGVEQYSAMMHEITEKYEHLKEVLSQLEEKRHEYEHISRRIVEVRGKLDKVNVSIQNDLEKLSEIEKAEKEVSRLDSVQKEYQDIEGRIKDMEEAKEYAQKVSEKERSITRIEANLSGKMSKLEEYAGIEQERGRLVILRSEIEAEKDVYEKEQKDIEMKIREYRNKKEEIMEHMNRIEGMGPDGVCPTCERRLDEQYEILMKKFREEVSGIEKRLKEDERHRQEVNARVIDVRKRMEALEKKERWIERKIGEYESLLEEIKRLEGELSEEKEDLVRVQEEIKKKGLPAFDEKEWYGLRKRSNELRQELGYLEGCRQSIAKKPEIEMDLKNKEKEREDLTYQIRDLETTLKGIMFNESEYESLRKEKDRIETEKKSVEKVLHERELKVREKRYEWENLRKELERLEEEKKRIDKLNEEVELLQVLRAQMENFWEYMMSYTRPILADYTFAFLSDVLDYERVELNEEYELMIYREGSPRPITEYSGGEQDIMNLCMRLALARMISELKSSNINVIILDEVFGSLDPFRRANLLGVLNNLSKKFSQVILITHVEEIKDMTGSYIYVKKSGNISILETG